MAAKKRLTVNNLYLILVTRFIFQVKEAVELPLTHFDLYKQIGIDPPRGVLMYGPPGCGKTMLAKAVAHHTTASFIRVVGSEFVQKYLGEGPRMVSFRYPPPPTKVDSIKVEIWAFLI